MTSLRSYSNDFTRMVIVFAFLATVPLWISSVGLYDYIAIEIIIWCIYAMGYNLALGYTGLPSFGHGAFFGIGAYAMAMYQVHEAGTSLWIGLLLSVLAGAAAGGFSALFMSHRRGIYFSLMTIAFGQVFWFVAIKKREYTNGEDGLLNVQRLPVDFGLFSLDVSSNQSMYFLGLAFFILVVVGLWMLIHSPFGYIIQSLKQNETRTWFLGYNVHLFKWISFTLSTGISGLAGGLFALTQRSAFPDVMALHWSGIIVMMTIVGGGLVSFWGPVLGVMFYFIMRDFLGTYTSTWILWFGVSFMVVILFEPHGIAGLWMKISQRIFKMSPGHRLLPPDRTLVPAPEPSNELV